MAIIRETGTNLLYQPTCQTTLVAAVWAYDLHSPERDKVWLEYARGPKFFFEAQTLSFFISSIFHPFCRPRQKAASPPRLFEFSRLPTALRIALC